MRSVVMGAAKILLLSCSGGTLLAASAGTSNVSATATVTVTGAEQSPGGTPDQGALTISINGMTETVYYGYASNPACLAAGLAAKFSRDHIKDGLYAKAGANQNQDPSVITFQLTSGTFGNPTVSGSSTSFGFSFSGFGMTSSSVADTGTVTLQVGGTSIATASYGSTSTPASIAQDLASQTNSLVSVSASGANLQLQAKQAGASSNYSYTLSATTSNPNLFGSPSFVSPSVTGNLSGGADPNTQGGSVYSYSITNSSGESGYDGTGNVVNMTDSVMGTWHYGYDDLNRLNSGNATTGSYAGQSTCWTYDNFGNRLTESVSTTPCASSPTPTFAVQYSPDNPNNQIISANYAYDSAGNLTGDGVNTYLYDAENRLCAVNSSLGMIGYQYDANGNRVGKGLLTSMSCDLTANGYLPTSEYVLDQNGHQMTEVAVGSSGVNWQHTNVTAGESLIATYDNTGLHFYLNDSLGTRRVQTDAAGNTEQTCQSLAFGNRLNCALSITAPTEEHFTGKERDTESGLDYFGARYYGSNIGRFMSPDPLLLSATLENPQSWNRYIYGLNNPLKTIDPEGLYPSPAYTCVRGGISACLNDEQRRVLSSSNVKGIDGKLLSGESLYNSLSEKQQNAFVNITDRLSNVNLPGGNALSQISSVSGIASDRIFANVSVSLELNLAASSDFTKVGAGLHSDYNAISFKDTQYTFGNVQFSFAAGMQRADIDIDIGNIAAGDLVGTIVHAGEVVQNSVFGTKTNQDTVRKILIGRPSTQAITPSPSPNWNRK